MTAVTAGTNLENIKRRAKWIEEPMPQGLLAEALEIFKPVKNIGHLAGLAKSN